MMEQNGSRAAPGTEERRQGDGWRAAWRDGRRRWGRGRGRGEQPMVPEAEFTSYYGRPVLKEPVWEASDVASYLFLGGLAGSSSTLAAGAQLTGRPALARAAKIGAAGAGGLAVGALVHDLGRPARFVNMLRVFKPSSPMSLGSWLLSVYVPAAGTAALCAVLEASGSANGAARTSSWLPRTGAAATAGAAVLGPAVASYTAALLADTAVPAWHEARAELPYMFVGSGAIAAAGLGLAAAPVSENAPARRLAVLGGTARFLASQSLKRRVGMAAEPYKSGKSGALVQAGQVLGWAGVIGAFAARRSRIGAAASGAALLAASACTRFGIFEAGRASARDPKYTVVPQRQRKDSRVSRNQDAAA